MSRGLDLQGKALLSYLGRQSSSSVTRLSLPVHLVLGSNCQHYRSSYNILRLKTIDSDVCFVSTETVSFMASDSLAWHKVRFFRGCILIKDFLVRLTYAAWPDSDFLIILVPNPFSLVSKNPTSRLGVNKTIDVCGD